MMLLTDTERKRFLAYLNNSIETSRAIIEQMEKLPGASVLVPQEKTNLAGHLIVASHLKSMTVETIT